MKVEFKIEGDNIVIPLNAFQDMRDDLIWLRCLEKAGVNSWEGRNKAEEIYESGIFEKEDNI